MEPILNLSVSLGRRCFTKSHKLVKRKWNKGTLAAAHHAVSLALPPSSPDDICISKEAIAFIQNVTSGI